uniref:Serpin domain-containing protein n=1 Tax=Tetradesmus obliquus TaxID=3088 RepID=A0A383VP56_TETOB|eukprot:jgi/Sobl393_1/14780/SZX66670.1
MGGKGAGPLSQTHRELWAALSQSPAAALGNASLPALTQAEAALNNQTAALLAALLAQTRSSSGSSSSSSSTELGIANGVWTKQLPVQQAFADSMWRLYRTPVKAVNSSDPINAWARDKTGGRISQAVPPGTPFDLIVTNTVYFRAAWQFGFDPGATMDQDFTTYVNGTPQVVQVRMMYRKFQTSDLVTGDEVLYGLLPGWFRAVKLPYKDSSIVAYAVLPDAARYSNASIDAAAADVSPRLLFNTSLWRPLWRFRGKLEVQLPRFKITTNQIQLKQALRALNITAAFSATAADFNRLSAQPTFITDVVQSVAVNVDERGTEAAAVTAGMMTVTEYIPERVTPLVFNRPFLFWIVDDATQTVLFQGTVKDPSKTS